MNSYNSATPIEGMEKPVIVDKSTYRLIFVILILIIMFLPFVTTFNEILTRVVENAGWYKPIRDLIVPYLVRMISLVLKMFGIFTEQSLQTITVKENALSAGGSNIYISWNCIGWQSFLLFLLTLLTGLQGNFSVKSKFYTIIFGLLGTFWINIFRISFIVLIAHWCGRLPATIFHDYGSTFVIVIWLFFFWWVSYTYLLEKKPNMT